MLGVRRVAAVLGASRSSPSLLLAPLGVRHAGNLKEVKNRMKTVENISKITSSMKMVASAKVRALEASLKQAKAAAASTNSVFKEYNLNDTEGKNLILAMTSDRGLCGGVNSIIGKTIKAMLEANPATKNSRKIMIVGEKGVGTIRRLYSQNIVRSFSELSKQPPTFPQAAGITQAVMAEDFDTLTVVYNEFKNVVQYNTRTVHLPSYNRLTDEAKGAKADVVAKMQQFEQESDGLEAMYEFHLANSLYYYLLEQGTSEMSARMTAMDNATTNAKDMIGRLRLKYNRTRQAVITTELTEIISGAESLKG